MSSYPLDRNDPRHRVERLHRTRPDSEPEHGTDARFSVDFVHRLRFTEGAFDPRNPVFADLLRAATHLPAKTLLFVDDGVAAAWPGLSREVEAYVDAHSDVMSLAGPLIEIPGGEQCKNDPSLLQSILGSLDQAGMCRQSFAIAIGGGAVLDLVGFAAGIAHRGVRLIRFPTTTLGQSDSGVGVKNGVNTFEKKNFCGSFNVPWAVVNDERFLTSLSDRDWRSGFSEAIKVALIKDRGLFEQIERSEQAVMRRDYSVANPILRKAALLHMRHITDGGDPFEMTTARPLDFGHWSAHKLEQMSDFRLRHGEAVAIGVALDTVYSAICGRLDWNSAKRVLNCLEQLGFKLYDREMERPETLLEGIEEFRQHLGGQLTVTLVESIGRAVDIHELDRERILAAIDCLAVGVVRPERD